MNTAYFLTGSFNDLDNDFELKITMEKKETATLPAVKTVLIDVNDANRQLWETSQETFLKCLEAMDGFLSENFITLYSKILTSPLRDPDIDKELEGFIINRLDL